MTLYEWLHALPNNAMISGVDDRLTRKPDGSIACSAYWWSPEEAMSDWDKDDLDSEGLKVKIYDSVRGSVRGDPRDAWAVRLATGGHLLKWAALRIPDGWTMARVPRCTQNTGPCGEETIRQCTLRADHDGPHFWDCAWKPRDEYIPEEFVE